MTIMGIDSLDAIVISVGGNDIGFPRIVANCLSPAMFGLPPRCSENTELRQEINVGIPDESTILGFDNLLDGYHRLDSHIRETLNPHHILIVGYPNPTRDENGQYCHHFGDGFPILHEHWSITEGFFGEPLPSFLVGGRISNITAADNEWIETDIINRLNGIIEDAAQEFDWIFVGGMDRLTRRKGYCSNDPWFNTPSSSWGVQSDLYGTAHPNRYGYDAYQQVIQKAIVENLEMRVAPLPMVRPESFGWWIGQNGIQERGIWPVTTTHWQGRGITNHTLIVGAMVFPTARVIEQVELEASLNQPRLSAFDDGVEIRQVTAASGNLAGTEHLYRTELPFSPISMCDWVHYRWRVTYSGPGLEATLTSEVMQVHATAHSNGYGAVCPPMSN
jgi:hypothetical protein